MVQNDSMASLPEKERRDATDKTLPVTVWATEVITPQDHYNHGLVEILVAKRTKYQDLLIGDKGVYGRALFLDGRFQLAEGDQAYYSETLAHVPALLHGTPKTALVLGGGDGGVVRQLLKWKCIERVVVVDIDGEAVNACKRWLEKTHGNCWDDPRVELLIEDALVYIGRCSDKFDVVLSDLTDPVDDSPSLKLFCKEFFSSVKGCMEKNGVLAVQSGAASLLEHRYHFPRIRRTLNEVFSHAVPFQVFAPSYGSPLGFCVASDSNLDIFRNAAILDKLLKEGLSGHLEILDGRAFQASFCLPVCVQRAMKEESVVYSESSIMPEWTVRSS